MTTVMSMEEQKSIRLDRMRFTKNTFSSRLVYLAILFNVLYFVSVYESDVGNWYYQALIGVSIVYNLLFMLVAFLGSEGVKNYKIGYGYCLLGLGAGQIIRIFILPFLAHSTVIKRSVMVEQKRTVVEGPVMESGQFVFVIACLILSALCCLVAGAVAVQRSRKLAAYQASMAEVK